MSPYTVVCVASCRWLQLMLGWTTLRSDPFWTFLRHVWNPRRNWNSEKAMEVFALKQNQKVYPAPHQNKQQWGKVSCRQKNKQPQTVSTVSRPNESFFSSCKRKKEEYTRSGRDKMKGFNMKAWLSFAQANINSYHPYNTVSGVRSCSFQIYHSDDTCLWKTDCYSDKFSWITFIMTWMDQQVMTKMCIWQQGHFQGPPRAFVKYLILVLLFLYKISTHPKLFSPTLIYYFKKRRAKIQKWCMSGENENLPGLFLRNSSNKKLKKKKKYFFLWVS